jgi:hypothetical protein
MVYKLHELMARLGPPDLQLNSRETELPGVPFGETIAVPVSPLEHSERFEPNVGNNVLWFCCGRPDADDNCYASGDAVSDRWTLLNACRQHRAVLRSVRTGTFPNVANGDADGPSSEI